MESDDGNLNWSRTYFAILANQTLVVGVVVLVAIAMLGESYRASKAADLLLPALTRWYFTIGPAGLALTSLLSLAVTPTFS